MLPFFSSKKAAGVIIARRGKRDLLDASPKVDMSSKKDGDPEFELAMEDILRAVQSDDPKGMGDALKAAFQILKARPEAETREEIVEGND